MQLDAHLHEDLVFFFLLFTCQSLLPLFAMFLEYLNRYLLNIKPVPEGRLSVDIEAGGEGGVGEL